MAPMSSSGLPPHWTMDFWVADVGATADEAAELRGKVIVPLFDYSVGKQAVLADPQGAVFIVSKVAAKA
jgi:predicted enzyme related to lactoylglutathione lyase